MLSSTAPSTSLPKSFKIPGEIALALHRVSKRFYYDTHRSMSMRQWFIRRVLRQPLPPPPPGFSIADLDLTIAKGEAVAVVGANGSGKSTLLRLMGGIYHPTSGRIERHGRLAAVLELGAGFHPELTGGENIQIYAAVLGLEQRRFKEAFPAIIEFAGIDDVLDMPVKHYSTGMQARLALSVALTVDSDILVLDEALSVGDRAFREKVKARMQAYHQRGGTLVLVSHDPDELRAICTRAICLHQGRLVDDGDVGRVLDAYRRALDGR
jgi:ABC-type polysaccharide/polyol phosphate transport system ATPase subunit